MGNLASSYAERVVYICTCDKGKGPHIHWDSYRNEPEKLNHPEPWPELQAKEKAK